MNERIRQLASQCWETTDRGVPIGEFTEFNKEKFAELIVRRVISVYNDSDTFKTSTYDDNRVLEYFGIE